MGPSGSGRTTALRAVAGFVQPVSGRVFSAGGTSPGCRRTCAALVDFMLTEKAQRQVSAVGGGFSARTDVKATDANAIELAKLIDGVDIFEPDWRDIDKNLPSYVDARKSATGS